MTLRQIGRTLRSRWYRRPRLDMSLPSTPMWFLIFNMVLAAVYAAWLASLLAKFVPMYFEAVDQAPELSVQSVVVTVQMLLLGAAAWCFRELWSVCQTELRKRIFG